MHYDSLQRVASPARIQQMIYENNLLLEKSRHNITLSKFGISPRNEKCMRNNKINDISLNENLTNYSDVNKSQHTINDSQVDLNKKNFNLTQWKNKKQQESNNRETFGPIKNSSDLQYTSLQVEKKIIDNELIKLKRRNDFLEQENLKLKNDLQKFEYKLCNNNDFTFLLKLEKLVDYVLYNAGGMQELNELFKDKFENTNNAKQLICSHTQLELLIKCFEIFMSLIISQKGPSDHVQPSNLTSTISKDCYKLPESSTEGKIDFFNCKEVSSFPGSGLNSHYKMDSPKDAYFNIISSKKQEINKQISHFEDKKIFQMPENKTLIGEIQQKKQIPLFKSEDFDSKLNFVGDLTNSKLYDSNVQSFGTSPKKFEKLNYDKGSKNQICTVNVDEQNVTELTTLEKLRMKISNQLQNKNFVLSNQEKPCSRSKVLDVSQAINLIKTNNSQKNTIQNNDNFENYNTQSTRKANFNPIDQKHDHCFDNADTEPANPLNDKNHDVESMNKKNKNEQILKKLERINTAEFPRVDDSPLMKALPGFEFQEKMIEQLSKTTCEKKNETISLQEERNLKNEKSAISNKTRPCSSSNLLNPKETMSIDIKSTKRSENKSVSPVRSGREFTTTIKTNSKLEDIRHQIEKKDTERSYYLNPLLDIDHIPRKKKNMDYEIKNSANFQYKAVSD